MFESCFCVPQGTDSRVVQQPQDKSDRWQEASACVEPESGAVLSEREAVAQPNMDDHADADSGVWASSHEQAETLLFDTHLADAQVGLMLWVLLPQLY